MKKEKIEPKTVELGRGVRANWPYEVLLDLTREHEPLILASGSGHGSMGGYFSLQEAAREEWNDQLQLCNCEWLQNLARQEIERGEVFSATQIWHKRPRKFT